MSGKNGSAVKTRTTRDQDGDGIIRICEYELGEVHGPRIFCDSVREGLTQHARVDVCRETNKAVDSCTQPRIIDKAKPDVVTPDQGMIKVDSRPRGDRQLVIKRTQDAEVRGYKGVHFEVRDCRRSPLLADIFVSTGVTSFQAQSDNPRSPPVHAMFIEKP